MDVLDNIETITYKHGDIIKYTFSIVGFSYGSSYTLNTGDINSDLETYVVTYKNGVCHSINGQPAIIIYNEFGSIRSFTWCYEGKIHREQGLPAHITRWGKYEYTNNILIKDTKKHNASMMYSIDDQYND